MSILAAILLGLLQGVTEFLPISSTGHLVLVDGIFDLHSSFEFDVLLNIGTLAALIIYYRNTIVGLIRDSFVNLRVLASLLVATVPAIIFGYFGDDFIENTLHSEWVVVFMLLIIGVLMIITPKRSKGKPLESIGFVGSAKIGIAQALALIPGTSRSGITILAGQQQGMSSIEAAKFSFMMAIPIISGATLKVAISDDGRNFIASSPAQLFWGNLASFVAGIVAVSYLINILGKKGLRPFGWYRVILGVVLAILLFGKII